MEEKNQTEISPGQGDRQSSDKESIFTLMEKGDLFDPGCPLSLKSALWLDFFLDNGAEAFKEKWLLLPSEEKNLLGIIFLKYYLHQPFFIGISREVSGGMVWTPLVTERKGRLLQVAFESEGKRGHQIYYPLQHDQLWPNLLQILVEDFIPFSGTLQSLERELALASDSRLDHLRQRADTLRIFFSGPATKDDLRSQPINSAEPLKKENAKKNILDQETEIKMEPALLSVDSAMPEDRTGPPTPVKKKKKTKSAQGQMKLF
jgi:hypothetical protein